MWSRYVTEWCWISIYRDCHSIIKPIDVPHIPREGYNYYLGNKVATVVCSNTVCSNTVYIMYELSKNHISLKNRPSYVLCSRWLYITSVGLVGRHMVRSCIHIGNGTMHGRAITTNSVDRTWGRVASSPGSLLPPFLRREPGDRPGLFHLCLYSPISTQLLKHHYRYHYSVAIIITNNNKDQSGWII